MDFNFVLIFLFGVLGLLVGSFLNVVIHRLPKMMEREWLDECASLSDGDVEVAPVYNLALPRSCCPRCDHEIKWYENVPVVSYLFLRGRCSSCKVKISIRYPSIELLTGFLFAWCAYDNNLINPTIAWCFFVACLLSLTFIDIDTQLLPDNINYILLWVGLFSSVMGWTGVSPVNAIYGALGGYLSLWIITKIFYLLTKKQGMGNGDFKLYAALGVWFGWQALIPIILLASLVGAVVGILIKIIKKEGMDVPMPFGPFLTGAGLLLMLLGLDYVLIGMNLLME